MDYMFTFLKKLDWQISEKSVSFITLYKKLKSSFYAPIEHIKEEVKTS